MPRPKPKLVLDTNMADKLSFDRQEFDIDRIKDKIRRSYRVVVSPLTVIELLNGVIRGTTDAHLKDDQCRFRTLLGGNPVLETLRFPIDFSLRHVLGIKSTLPNFNAADFRQWVKVVLAANSRYELDNGYVRIPNRGGKTFGLDSSVIAGQQHEGKADHQEFLQRAMSRTSSFPPREEWAKMLGSNLGVDLTKDQSALLGERWSAAYEYQSTIFVTAAANTTYNVTKHDGDWIDNQHLFYLCDPNIMILTDDQGIRTKCSNSEQRNRILLMKEI